jgi:hypothetical protein
MHKQVLKELLFRTTDLPEKTDFCANDQDLALFFDGLLSGPSHESIKRHVANCGFCQARLGFLSRVEQDSGPTDLSEECISLAKQMGRKPPRRKSKNWPVWAAAAVMAITLSVTTFRGDRPVDQMENFPETISDTGGEARQIRSMGAKDFRPGLLSPLEGAVVKPGDLVIRWTRVPDVIFYQLFVMNEFGDLLISERVDGNEWVVRESDVLEPGSDYFVRVEARVAGSAALSTEHVSFSYSGGD